MNSVDKVRYGVIGINGIGQVHIRAAQKNIRTELTAIVDIDSASVQEHAQRLGVRGFTDYRDLLSAGIVDAVSIATPHHLHTPIALACLDAGLHVFLEKPLAPTISEAESIVKAAKSKGLKLSVAYQYRTFRSYRIMKHLIEQGIIGNVQRILWSWSNLRRNPYFERYPWKGKWKSGGGLLSFWVGHDLDTICWLVGKPAHVSAVMGNQIHHIEAEDILSCNIVFQNGALATFQATLNQPGAFSVRQIAGDGGMMIIQESKSLTYDKGDKLLVGTYEERLQSLIRTTTSSDLLEEAKIQWTEIDVEKCTDRARSVRRVGRGKLMLGRLWGKQPKPAPLPFGLENLFSNPRSRRFPRHGLLILIDSFVDSILDGNEPIVTGEDALQTQELMNAITLSAIKKKTVDLPLDPNEYDEAFEQLIQGKIQIPRFHHPNV